MYYLYYNYPNLELYFLLHVKWIIFQIINKAKIYHYVQLIV